MCVFVCTPLVHKNGDLNTGRGDGNQSDKVRNVTSKRNKLMLNNKIHSYIYDIFHPISPDKNVFDPKELDYITVNITK